MSQKGRCVVCGVRGRGDKDFLCENCANPEKNYYACTTCELLEEIDLEQLKLLKQASELEFPIKGGVTIKVSSCHRCDPEMKKNVEIMAYATKGL